MSKRARTHAREQRKGHRPRPQRQAASRFETGRGWASDQRCVGLAAPRAPRRQTTRCRMSLAAQEADRREPEVTGHVPAGRGNGARPGRCRLPRPRTGFVCVPARLIKQNQTKQPRLITVTARTWLLGYQRNWSYGGFGFKIFIYRSPPPRTSNRRRSLAGALLDCSCSCRPVCPASLASAWRARTGTQAGRGLVDGERRAGHGERHRHARRAVRDKLLLLLAD